MLDANLASQLRQLLTNITEPVELVATLDDRPVSAETRELLQEIAGMSDSVSYVEEQASDAGARVPSFVIRRASDTAVAVTFAGLPLGHEFTSLVLALLQVGGHPSKAAAETIEQVRALKGEHHFETFFSQSCQNCPDVVQALNLMAVLNPGVTHTAIDGAVFPKEAEERGVLAVPTVFLNGEDFGSGRMSLEDIVGKVDTGAAEAAAARLGEQEPFEVLVLGGGPAGVTAAIYAARKGIRTGLVADRIGGQVNDTMAIENLSGTPHTEGPRLAADLERHLVDYDIEVMKGQRAAELLDPEDGRHGVRLESGAVLRSRTLIVATGAAWRLMNVPGEDEYRNKGVTFCPHCDGPLFKGKRVAVIGGGNSGVEAAIDLAGVVGHVTVLEFLDTMRADEVLQRKLRSLPNVDVVLSAQTTEVAGDGSRVTGLAYNDRTTGEARTVELDGVFVQIGLVPSTQWLKDSGVRLTDRGEIEVDAKGATSVPGIFAAGDCTTTPYKQIVVAFGAGSTAALGAFDHLIRESTPDPDAAVAETNIVDAEREPQDVAGTKQS